MKGLLVCSLCLLAPGFGLRVAGFAASVPNQTAYSITDFATCADARMDAPHDWHVPSRIFRTDDSKFYAWVEVTNVSGIHSVEMKAYRPDGTYHGAETQTINETNGVADWWRMAAWWRIKDDKAAETTGRWKLDLLIDGALQRTIYFDIDSKNLDPPAGASSRISLAALAGSPAPACILEASSELINWTPIQTNNLPARLFPAAGTASFRLTLSGAAAGVFVVESSTDLLNWTPFQTNTVSVSTDTSDPGRGAAHFYRAVVRW